MYRYRQDLNESSRFVQPKIGAWAVSKSSTHKLTAPSHIRQASTELKTETKTNLTRRATAIGSSQKAGKGTTEKHNHSNLLGVIKAVLEDDSQDFSKRLNALEPSVTSITPALKEKTKSKAQRKKQSLLKTSESAAPEKKVLNPEIEFGRLLVPPIIQGEKLVTIGGYIISLQSKHEHISCMVKPRVSSDKDGLELEIKVTGCHPSEIKFEKRYNTLIVIGVNKGPPRSSDGGSTTFFTGGTNKKWSKDMTLKSLTTRKDITLPAEQQPDEMLEIVNIFVPKNTPLSQIFISKPDPKGRIFVKGP